MIILDIEQGSEEWFEIHKGIPTASEFDKIITPLGKISKQAQSYMIKLIAEKFSNDGYEFTNHWLERGLELEPEARRFYEFTRDVKVKQVGFIYLDENKQVGGSPDGLIGKDGGLEIKCLKAENHIEMILSGKMPIKYIPQIQGNLWISGRKWWDFLGYHPSFKSFIVRIERDEEYISLIEKQINIFLKEMEKLEKQIR